MANLRNIRELINSLQRGSKLLDDMFAKRKTVSMDYEMALSILDDNERILDLLIRNGIIERTGDTLELAEVYLRFFEEVLEVNETVSVALVREYLDNLRLHIDSCQMAGDTQTRARFMRSCRHDFIAIERVAKRNIIDLKRNTDNTYKQERNFKIKRLHLRRMDEKRSQIGDLIRETQNLIEDEETFLNTVADAELRQTVSEVRSGLHESARNLIDIEKQIIVYLNKIDYQSQLIRKLRQLKYLKDQVMLDTSSDIGSVIESRNPVWFEPQPRYTTKVSLSFLQNDDDALAVLEGLHNQLSNKASIRQRLSEPLRPEELVMREEEQRAFDRYDLISSFEAQSADLFKFIWQYDFRQDTTQEERLVLFLQLASQFSDRLDISDQCASVENITYPIIHSKHS